MKLEKLIAILFLNYFVKIYDGLNFLIMPFHN